MNRVDMHRYLKKMLPHACEHAQYVSLACVVYWDIGYVVVRDNWEIKFTVNDGLGGN